MRKAVTAPAEGREWAGQSSTFHGPTPTIKRYSHKDKQDDSETKGHRVIVRDKTQDGSGRSNIHQQHEKQDRERQYKHITRADVRRTTSRPRRDSSRRMRPQ